MIPAPTTAIVRMPFLVSMASLRAIRDFDRSQEQSRDGNEHSRKRQHYRNTEDWGGLIHHDCKWAAIQLHWQNRCKVMNDTEPLQHRREREIERFPAQQEQGRHTGIFEHKPD